MIRPSACCMFPVLAFLCDGIFSDGIYVRLSSTGGGAVITTPNGAEGFTFPEGNLLARHDALTFGEVSGEVDA